jgi:LmbE family N-acetylglucosaminyl deacetylase
MFRVVSGRVLWFACGAAAAVISIAMWNSTPMQSQPAPPTTSTVPSTLWKPVSAAVPNDGKLRIIAFGAHPDDCELRAAGCAAMWAAAGHKVKFVSCTNGDIGHWGMAGGPLAQRRKAEVQEAAKILGIETEVLDIHDGELIPDLDTRRKITRLIRDWKADLVLSHRPNDYHPDHRNVGVVVQDAAFMVIVPHFCPDTPFLERNPVFMYYEDKFTKPLPFKPDVVVGIDNVIDKKFAVMEALHSQFFEGGAIGNPRLPPDPSNPAAVAARKKEVHDGFDRRFHATAERFGLQLAEWYGPKLGQNVKYAEAFEVCEYGRTPTRDELRKLFPFFPAQ